MKLLHAKDKLSNSKNVQHFQCTYKFMSCFYRYLLHVEGGADHTRQVHNILSTLDPAGSDLACLARRMGMDVWNKFCVPKLRNKQLMGNTIKTYLRSLEYFLKFIAKGLLYKTQCLDQCQKRIILSLRECLPDYRSTFPWRTAHQVTTRKVDEAFSRILISNLRQVEVSDHGFNYGFPLHSEGPPRLLTC